MDILIENKSPKLPRASSTAFSRRRDMPKTIAALPPRLRMKILCRSEQNVENFDQTERNSPLSGLLDEITDSGHPPYETTSTTTTTTSQPGQSTGKEPAVPKIVIKKPCQEKGVEQRNNILAAFTAFDDHLSDLGRPVEGTAVERTVPSWYEKSLVKNKAILTTLQELPRLNRDIWLIIDKQNYFQAWMEFKQVRQSLQKIFIRLLETNLPFCCKENIELYFWKVLYYHAIECFKKLLKTCADQISEMLQQVTLDLIAEGVGFYQSALEILKNCHSFAIDSTSPEDNSDLLPRISAQKIYLNLGDLARYEEQIVGGSNFFKAKELYHTARILIPTNGIPYNQLAILAIYSKRKFDAIYYHMRSLTASNPIQSAKESLKELFDEIRKKYDSQVDTKMLEKKDDAQKSCYKLAPIRKEIWIHPSGCRRLYRITPYTSKELYYLDERALKELPCDELNKRFQLSYLCAVGKLYTRIGMENFNRILFQMLSEFKEAIERGTFLFNKHRLLQIIALNIFAIECNTGESYEDSGSARTEMKNHAFNVSSLMFGTILNRANELLTVLMSTEETPIDRLSPELVTLLQAIKVWCDWLALNLPSWIPLPSISNYSLVNEYEMNPWDGFAEIITLLSSISRDHDVELEELYASKLDEDVFLDGFTPIAANSKCPIRTKRFNKTIEGIFRIKKLILFGSTFLCHCSPPILKRIAHDGKEFFINISSGPDDSATEDIDQPEFKEVSPEKEEVLGEGAWSSFLEKVQSGVVSENPEVGELIKRKQELEERKKMEETYQQNLQEILRKFGNIVHIEVRPKYLVPDTNCFIDSLQELQLIANDFRHYTLAVPLVVVNELEGLSKGFKPTSLSLLQLNRSKIHHFDEVSSSASRALQFIRGKNFAVKCVTSKGSFLNTSSFTYEENSDSYQSNDDKILATALNLCKINIEVREESQHAVSTSVVLLTTDRNLRVKALSKNLPVSELQEFLRWAKMEI